MKERLIKMINLPRILYFNCKVFGFREGLKMPIYISGNMKIGQIYRNCISITAPPKRFMIELGTGGSEGIPGQRGYISISKHGHIEFAGKAYFAQGNVIRIDAGQIKFGNNFNANKNCMFWCSHGMQIGDDVLFGYGVYLRDDDGHEILDNMESCKDKSISLGNHIWCSSNVSILKGVRLEDGCVVGYNSCLFKSFSEPNLLIGGYPAKVLKKNIQWRK